MTPSDAASRPGVSIADRTPVVVEPGGSLRIGTTTRRFDPNADGSLVASYIELLGEVRRGPIPGIVHLRRCDIDALADYAGVGTDEFIDELAIALGAGTRQRATVVSLFAAGVAVVGVATALVLAPSRPDVAAAAALRPVAPTAPVAVAQLAARALPRTASVVEAEAEAEAPGARAVAGAVGEAGALDLAAEAPSAEPVPIVGEDGNVYYVSMGGAPVPVGSGGGSDPVPVVGDDGGVHVVAVGEALPVPVGSGGGSDPVPVVGDDGAIDTIAVGDAPVSTPAP